MLRHVISWIVLSFSAACQDRHSCLSRLNAFKNADRQECLSYIHLIVRTEFSPP